MKNIKKIVLLFTGLGMLVMNSVSNFAQEWSFEGEISIDWDIQKSISLESFTQGIDSSGDSGFEESEIELQIGLKKRIDRKWNLDVGLGLDYQDTKTKPTFFTSFQQKNGWYVQLNRNWDLNSSRRGGVALSVGAAELEDVFLDNKPANSLEFGFRQKDWEVALLLETGKALTSAFGGEDYFISLPDEPIITTTITDSTTVSAINAITDCTNQDECLREGDRTLFREANKRLDGATKSYSNIAAGVLLNFFGVWDKSGNADIEPFSSTIRSLDAFGHSSVGGVLASFDAAISSELLDIASAINSSEDYLSIYSAGNSRDEAIKDLTTDKAYQIYATTRYLTQDSLDSFDRASADSATYAASNNIYNNQYARGRLRMDNMRGNLDKALNGDSGKFIGYLAARTVTSAESPYSAQSYYDDANGTDLVSTTTSDEIKGVTRTMTTSTTTTPVFSRSSYTRTVETQTTTLPAFSDILADSNASNFAVRFNKNGEILNFGAVLIGGNSVAENFLGKTEIATLGASVKWGLFTFFVNALNTNVQSKFQTKNSDYKKTQTNIKTNTDYGVDFSLNEISTLSLSLANGISSQKITTTMGESNTVEDKVNSHSIAEMGLRLQLIDNLSLQMGYVQTIEIGKSKGDAKLFSFDEQVELANEDIFTTKQLRFQLLYNF